MLTKLIIGQESKTLSEMLTNVLTNHYQNVEIFNEPEVTNWIELIARIRPELVIYGKRLDQTSIDFNKDQIGYDLPIIILIEDEDEEVNSEFWGDLNVIGVLQKPFEYQELIDNLSKIVQESPLELSQELPQFEAVDQELMSLFEDKTPSSPTSQDPILKEITATIDPVEQLTKLDINNNNNNNVDELSSRENSLSEEETIDSPSSPINLVGTPANEVTDDGQEIIAGALPDTFHPQSESTSEHSKDDASLDVFDNITSNIKPSPIEGETLDEQVMDTNFDGHSLAQNLGITTDARKEDKYAVGGEDNSIKTFTSDSLKNVPTTDLDSELEEIKIDFDDTETSAQEVDEISTQKQFINSDTKEDIATPKNDSQASSSDESLLEEIKENSAEISSDSNELMDIFDNVPIDNDHPSESSDDNLLETETSHNEFDNPQLSLSGMNKLGENQSTNDSDNFLNASRFEAELSEFPLDNDKTNSLENDFLPPTPPTELITDNPQGEITSYEDIVNENLAEAQDDDFDSELDKDQIDLFLNPIDDNANNDKEADEQKINTKFTEQAILVKQQLKDTFKYEEIPLKDPSHEEDFGAFAAIDDSKQNQFDKLSANPPTNFDEIGFDTNNMALNKSDLLDITSGNLDEEPAADVAVEMDDELVNTDLTDKPIDDVNTDNDLSSIDLDDKINDVNANADLASIDLDDKINDVNADTDSADIDLDDKIADVNDNADLASIDLDDKIADVNTDNDLASIDLDDKINDVNADADLASIDLDDKIADINTDTDLASTDLNKESETGGQDNPKLLSQSDVMRKIKSTISELNMPESSFKEKIKLIEKHLSISEEHNCLTRDMIRKLTNDT
ncbi:MAG: hypothetical protein JJV97_04800 [SAR324 cluster bacterium]|nr:hypothetical protein [SAR324 cluster bacterium]